MKYAFQLTSGQIIGEAPHKLLNNINRFLEHFTKTYVKPTDRNGNVRLPLFLKEL